jgi:putative membrane protein
LEFQDKSPRVVVKFPKTRAAWLIGAVSSLVILLVATLFLVPGRPAPGQLDVSRLPLLNASLNGMSALFLSAAYAFIRRGQVGRHRLCMLTAFGLSTLFLISYVIYHTIAGSTAFTGQGWIRPVYFSILISHILLASLVLPLALTTLFRAWQRTFVQHRRIARWTLPIWLYVSVSGVVVYLMLYHLPT